MGENFIGIGKGQINFIGHGAGLKLDEFLVFVKELSMKIEKDMTFVLKPEFVFSEEECTLKTPLLQGVMELRG